MCMVLMLGVGCSQFDFDNTTAPDQLVIPSETYTEVIEPLVGSLIVIYGDKLTTQQLTLVRDAMATLSKEAKTQAEINVFKVFIALATPVLLEEIASDVILDPDDAILVLAGLNILEASAVEGSFAAELIPIIKRQLGLTL